MIPNSREFTIAYPSAEFLASLGMDVSGLAADMQGSVEPVSLSLDDGDCLLTSLFTVERPDGTNYKFTATMPLRKRAPRHVVAALDAFRASLAAEES